MLSDLEKKRKAITDPTADPSQSLESYAGLYRHPLLGELRVQVTAEVMSFTFGTSYKGDLIHANHDTFFIKVSDPNLGKFIFNGPAHFEIDESGQVTSLFAMDREFRK
jgi:hypothetical protein